MAKLFFNQKLFHFFCQNVQMYTSIPYLMGNTVDFLPYMVETVGKKKKTAKHGKMRWTPKQ